MTTPTIKIAVSQADATLVQGVTLTAGMTNVPVVKFTFSPEWNTLGKTAVCRAGNITKTVLVNENNQITVPVECLATAGVNLIIGVYGANTTVVIPTVWCSCGEILDGTDYEEADNIGEVTENLVDQVLDAVADMQAVSETLETYAFKEVDVDDDDANQYGVVDVTIHDSNEDDPPAEDRTITFKFENLKGNGIDSIVFSDSDEYRGRLQIKTDKDILDETDGVIYDGIKEALDALDELTDRSEAYAIGTIDGTDVPSTDPAYHNNSKYYAESAASSASTATSAKSSAMGYASSASNAKTAAETAQGKAEAAQDAAEAAATSASGDAGIASGSASSAGASADSAADSASIAAGARDEALASSARAHDDAATASTAASNASTYATNASNSATTSSVNKFLAEAWAVGTMNGTDVSPSTIQYHNNAKYYSGLASGSATSAGNAQTAAETAQGLAEAAQTAAETAQGKAEDAQEAAETAAATFETDTTLSIAGKAADSKKTGDEISDLKSAFIVIDEVEYTLPSSAIIQGSYSNSSTAPGKWINNSKRIRNAGFIHVCPGYSFHFVPGENAAEMLWGKFANGSLIADSSWITTETTVTIPSGVDAIIVVFAKSGRNTDISPSDYDATLTINSKVTNTIESVSKKTTNTADACITSFSLAGVSSNSQLYIHNYSENEKIHVRCYGNKCNLLGRKKSDDSIVVLINNMTPSDDYTELTIPYDITSLGLYLYDTTKTTTIYLLGDEALRLYNNLDGKIDAVEDSLNASKVYGIIVFDEETETTDYTGKLVYGAVNSTITEYTYATGNYKKVALNSNPKVRVKGYGFDQSSNFALWAFTDSDGKVISRDTVNRHEALNWLEVDVPSGAAFVYVNGNNAIPSAIQVSNYSNDFYECYKAVKDKQSFKLITLGDSITKLGITDRGWVKYFIEKTGATLVANVAVDGAQLVDKEGTTYDGTPTDSNPTNNVLGNQVQKIINNNYTAPDLIMIAVGTNDGIFITADQIKAAYYDASNDLVPLADVDRTTGAGAYRYCTETLHNLYPNAVIVWCAPIYSAQASRRMDQIEAWGESLEIATRYSGQMFIDTFRCGINGVGETVGSNGEYLYDGLHPNANGAKHIGRYNASKIMPFIGNLINVT